ncbi:CGNR zinc finger domain-containing protein [Nocardioides bigeumensis]|jgi:predicted RNA-binding Zn ribbon-like protein|uniref:CGNR zinc finger domain-containing protein n=1 Tax=Nocardioides bigeumensis TaxID=433657 RepID=A0ABN2YCI2_9ACTN
MRFAHDTEVNLQAAVQLVNTAEDPETLETVADLDALLAQYEYTGRRDRDLDELRSIHELRPVLRELFLAERDHAVEIVNEMLAKAQALPQLARHDNWDWHLHAVDQSAPLATRITVETAMAMIDVIRADEMSRLGICADEGCEGIVLDLSRNRSRRFCSTTCGNRNAVAAYRARQASP